MLNRLIGGILLIVGTSIGGSLLALPLATAAGGFWHSSFLFFGAWIIMLLGALYIMEANLWFPENSNLVSMAKQTLGWQGQLVTWLLYLLLNYSLLAAYISGGTQLFVSLLQLAGIFVPAWLDAILFTTVLAIIVACGVATVDWANRAFMSLKLISYVLLITLLLPHANLALIENGKLRLLLGASLVIITSFGFATIVPSLRTYFSSNSKALLTAILIGSFIPLVCYLLWVFTVQTNLASSGAHGLIASAKSPNALADMTNALAAKGGGHAVAAIAHVFTSVCVLTSFLGVSLALFDFLADGTRLAKRGKNLVYLTLLTFLPPLAINLLYPGAFIRLLSYAGIICVLLLIVLPVMMVWSGRYCKNIAHGFRVFGGKITLAALLICSLLLLAIGIFS